MDKVDAVAQRPVPPRPDTTAAIAEGGHCDFVPPGLALPSLAGTLQKRLLERLVNLGVMHAHGQVTADELRRPIAIAIHHWSAKPTFAPLCGMCERIELNSSAST